jgi:hypothetical protein
MSTGGAICGLLVVRNAVAQGYPFVEAIRAALPLCDELLVGDGGSDDGTWEALEEVRDAFPGRVVLCRDEWPRGADRRQTVAAATTRLKERCRSPWCFQLQANEIVPAGMVASLRREPELYPAAELFRLPYLTLIGWEIAWHLDFRRRLVANRPEIVARGDGYDCGYAPSRLWRRPRRLLTFALRRRGERIVHLAEPIARYRALFPRSYLAKLRARAALPTAPGPWRRELAWAERVAEETATATPRAFWRGMKPFFDERRWRDGDGGADREDLPVHCMPDREGAAPELLLPLLDRWEYPVAESLAALYGVEHARP